MAMSNQYTLYHLHSDLSNGVTNIDSVTKYGEYIERAKECGMKAMAFTEHGSVFEWWHKKSAIEAAGMKYIHGIEAYLTLNIDEKIRDNYHCVLLAKNYDGFLELNSLVSKSFCRTDNHFYYVPRITFNELFATSDNIIITTACVGGVLGKGDEQVQQYYLDFLERNKHRCFLEVGHHMDEKQVTYNEKLLLLSKSTGVPLIAGTDTHVLNAEHEKGRSILQASKNITFDGEERWDLKFKTYDELVAAYREQGSLPEAEYMQAIENTNVMADMVEPFELDRGTKYPHIYSEPEKTFRDKIQTAVENHPYALKHHTKEELQKTIDEEFDVYKATKSIDFMLLQTYLREWEKQNGIQCGYGRGSVSGSMIAYLLGITQMDSMRYGLNFFRFMNPSRVTNADIDTDYSGKDRETIKRFLLKDKMNLPSIRSAEIITFNTIALKGAIRDVCRALYKDRADMNYLQVANHICKEAELHASAYGFSWNHSDAYSSIGYICGYLRYYYPLEFLTAALNIFGDNMDKTADITSYAHKVGIRVTLPKWGLSRGEYFFDRERKIIAKGLTSIKYMSAGLADELYNLAAKNKYSCFMDRQHPHGQKGCDRRGSHRCREEMRLPCVHHGSGKWLSDCMRCIRRPPFRRRTPAHLHRPGNYEGRACHHSGRSYCQC